MSMHRLLHDYPAVERAGTRSYGGSQLWLSREDLRKCGCGAVAMTDLALYLTRHHGVTGHAEANRDPIALEDYDRLCSSLQQQYLTMIPPFGITGLTLAAGLNRWFRHRDVPLRASWGVRTCRLWQAVAQMLDQDLPVILAVGANFPFFWKKDRLIFYRRNAEGRYFPASGAKAHYVTVTAMDADWLKVSSWGKAYFIRKEEYLQYGRTRSLPLTNNLLWLEKQ